MQDIQHGGNPLEGFHSCYCAHGPVCAVKCKVHPSLPASAHASAPASHVSQCLWLLCGTKRRWRGGLKLSCRTERQKKLKVLREREWVMQGGFPKRKPGRERARERARGKAKWVSESGNERDWQWMYLSRSQIINRDSVVWIERKRGGREREWERVRTWGKRDWGSGAKGTGFRGHEVRMEGRWRNGADGWRIIL